MSNTVKPLMAIPNEFGWSIQKPEFGSDEQNYLVQISGRGIHIAKSAEDLADAVREAVNELHAEVDAQAA